MLLPRTPLLIGIIVTLHSVLCIDIQLVGRTENEDYNVVVLQDTPVNSSFISLERIVPFGTNFSLTWITFNSPKGVSPEKTAAFKLDREGTSLLVADELRKYAGGYFDIRFTCVSAETGVQTAEKFRIFVVDSSHRVQIVVKKKPEVIEEDKILIMKNFKKAMQKSGLLFTVVNENFKFGASGIGRTDFSQGQICFVLLNESGFPLTAAQVLPRLRRTSSPEIQQFCDENQVLRITECVDSNTGFRFDELSIGLIILAIILSLLLIGTVIFIICWMRVRKLHAAVIATANMHQPYRAPPPNDYLRKPVTVLDDLWLQATLGNGMLVKRPPPSSTSTHYEWQESSLEVPDAESLPEYRPRSVISSAGFSVTECPQATNQCSGSHRQAHIPRTASSSSASSLEEDPHSIRFDGPEITKF